MSSDAAERSARATIAALARSANEPNGAAMLEAANATYRKSFYSRHECTLCGVVEIDPALPEKERVRQGDAAYRAHMLRLSRRSARLRSGIEVLTAHADQIDAELQRANAI